jgi:hypothetical protein
MTKVTRLEGMLAKGTGLLYDVQMKGKFHKFVN